MFLLRAERPDKYRDRVSVAVAAEQMFEREAERIAAEYGLDPKEVIAEAKQIAARVHPGHGGPAPWAALVSTAIRCRLRR